ncbi:MULTISPECIES: PRC-barrel domain-containing protein [unclassified Streptomyces]|uniref:PRC-barrel domain-containing protein n=1 Tax=unclassified Streptomyces TaxID=2593676 RepID=UPI00093AE805|nr:PRC-barrel domain-containing protein [Streptomyces sp. CB01580]OKJ31478.1 photosystem reaction center subunit H [Streptomyces sp. CB01580]
MIQMTDIREWRNQEVVDSGGHKIGELESVCVDTTTGEPARATVRVGLSTRHRLVFVPWRGAMVGPGYVRVAHDKKLAKRSPSIGMDGILPFEDEGAVFHHYGLAYAPGANGERQLARR